ncbi:glycoside hydrolase family 81 protein [Amniculicola lignicola CBS 123094]|uniref:glucan endo-1,3-beta-D-glucosidase n=1 Tax=Amniculicola lignicola CBS 123094 TaxID=1392246 RepID=A0A6A5WP49_9PLEO|nr:glycoside hydrolase family 81 protein [Amniculicola lignicola CBS 123094]
MGPSSSKQKPLSSSPDNKDSSTETWRESWISTLTSFGRPTTTTVQEPPDNIFKPINKDNILPQIPISRHHPTAKKGIEDDDKTTLQTNKFYANTFLGNQDMPVWTHPYSIWWGKGNTGPGVVQTWGMCIGHVEESELAYGPGDPAQYYINPLRRQTLILSAQEFGPETELTTDSHKPFSVNINLNRNERELEPGMTFPVVQGMSFVTGGYRNATPVIQCGGRGFRSISDAIRINNSWKYRIEDSDGRKWLAYINPAAGIDYDPTAFKKVDDFTFLGPAKFKGNIQIAKNPKGEEGEGIYDKAFGTFVVEAKLVATVRDGLGTYSLQYSKIGTGPLLMFALPHHIQSLAPRLFPKSTNLQLRTTTKGMATAIWTESLTCVEANLPTTMSFGPWTPAIGANKVRFSPTVIELINIVADRDLQTAMAEPVPKESLYYAGKNLAKFATILYVMKDILNSPQVPAGLDKLKEKLAQYVENRQFYPIFYDDSWKGIVSNAGFTDPGADYGNTFYNDHHFHFGYFVYTAAVIAYLDPAWLTQGDNKEWVQMLVKDYAESDYKGRDYPFSRSFDWYHGHSWAKGLYESADGKDEESTSEDGFASFAIKMWGKAIGDQDMEKRGNLMLAIQARSFDNYFYIQDNNTNHPARFIGHKVTGILFENKADYITYFGNAPQLIHGIHMLPLSPASVYLRSRTFVQQEWDKHFSNGRAMVEGGWRGILYANLALIDPKTSYAFFRDGIQGMWDDAWIDGGASRTWYLVWSAALGGAR